MTRDPLGARGDFITAPEISQMFGELIGLWMAAVWQQMGAPENVRLVELGPGRGTLMADALRARQGRAGLPRRRRRCIWSRSARCCRRSSSRRWQRSAMPVALAHSARPTCRPVPSIVVANEFFDALPVQSGGQDRATAGIERAGRDRRRRRARVRRSRRADAAFRRDCCRAALREAPRRLDLRMARRHDGAGARPPHAPRRRRRAGDRLRPRRKRARRHLAGGRPPRLCRPAGRAGRASTSPPMSISRRWRTPSRHGRRMLTGRSSRRDFLRSLGIETRAATLKAQGHAAQAAEIDARWRG